MKKELYCVLIKYAGGLKLCGGKGYGLDATELW